MQTLLDKLTSEQTQHFQAIAAYEITCMSIRRQARALMLAAVSDLKTAQRAWDSACEDGGGSLDAAVPALQAANDRYAALSTLHDQLRAALRRK